MAGIVSGMDDGDLVLIGVLALALGRAQRPASSAQALAARSNCCPLHLGEGGPR